MKKSTSPIPFAGDASQLPAPQNNRTKGIIEDATIPLARLREDLHTKNFTRIKSEEYTVHHEICEVARHY